MRISPLFLATALFLVAINSAHAAEPAPPACTEQQMQTVPLICALRVQRNGALDEAATAEANGIAAEYAADSATAAAKTKATWWASYATATAEMRSVVDEACGNWMRSKATAKLCDRWNSEKKAEAAKIAAAQRAVEVAAKRHSP